MKTVGIITEYNPFHNGHLHHIEETKRLSKADRLICVMSGNFTQRGEPTIVDKFTRTKWALNNGADLVIELPFVFTVQNADIFAFTSVSILNKLGVDEIYFGSETNDIAELSKLGDILVSEPYNDLIKLFLKEGYSYPTSADLTMKKLYPNDAFDLPNNILGIQYILAGKKLKSKIKFKTIKRIKSNYFDDELHSSTIQSATAIRKLVSENKDIVNYVPEDVFNSLTSRKLISYEDYYEVFKYIINSSTPKDLKDVFNVNEGLENRLLKFKEFSSVQNLIDKLLTRRYTNSKIKRTLAHVLINTKKNELTDFNVPYIRILGMNDLGRNYLNKIKHDLDVPLISKVKEGIHPYLDVEIRASRVYSLVSDKDIYKQEFKQPIY